LQCGNSSLVLLAVRIQLPGKASTCPMQSGAQNIATYASDGLYFFQPVALRTKAQENALCWLEPLKRLQECTQGVVLNQGLLRTRRAAFHLEAILSVGEGHEWCPSDPSAGVNVQIVHDPEQPCQRIGDGGELFNVLASRYAGVLNQVLGTRYAAGEPISDPE